ncbi:MAG: hypothetical protein JO252_21210, partial [Planctomycetaceae bacterium]|nr:hypothetical protein [Planctomycetaceae bacterium]
DDRFDDSGNAQLIHDFNEAVGHYIEHEVQAAQVRHKAHLASLTEEIRQLLLQAAYIELAQAANRDLFDEEMPLNFSELAIQHLKRHKYPFAGALKMVDVSGLCPRPEDPKYARIREQQKEVLSRRFEVIRSKLGEALANLVQAGKLSLPTGIMSRRNVHPAITVY